MKKLALLLTAAATMMLPTLGFSADAGPGCGLGTIIFKGQSGFFPHTSAATTNGTSANQWFGLTSDTSDCNSSGMVSNEHQREIFVASNMDQLSLEMAQGGGLHLEALAGLLEISPANQPEFYRLTQEHLPGLLSSSKDGAKALLATLDKTLSADAALTSLAQ